MSALMFDIDGRFPRLRIGITIDHRIGLLVRSSLPSEDGLVFKRNFRWGQLVNLVAGGFAGATPDTASNISENAKAVGITGKMLHPRSQLRFAN
jgi:hypothetical protein